MRVRGVDLAVRDSGERGRGPTFLWGHGVLCSMAMDDDAALLDWEALAREARLVRYDARGHGRSEASLDPAVYRWPELARDLWALADAVGARTAVLGGISMGCATALHAAVQAPRRVEGLVLAAPPTAWETRPRQARVYRAMAAVVERVGTAPLRCLARLSGLRSGAPHLAQLQGAAARHLGRSDRRAVAAALRGAARSDLPRPEALARIAAPALVLAWRGDPGHPLSTAERLAETLPRAELRVADDLDAVRAWSPAVCELLATLSPAPRVASASPPPPPA